VAGKGMKRNEYGILVGETSRNETICKSRHRWEDIIKIGVTK